MNLATFCYTLWENGWLGTCEDEVRSQAEIGLADVGYMREDWNFEVVANFHTLLTSEDGGVPTRKTTRSYFSEESQENIVVVEHAGKSSARQGVFMVLLVNLLIDNN